MYQYEFVVWAYNGGQLRIAGYIKLFRSEETVGCVRCDRMIRLYVEVEKHLCFVCFGLQVCVAMAFPSKLLT